MLDAGADPNIIAFVGDDESTALDTVLNDYCDCNTDEELKEMEKIELMIRNAGGKVHRLFDPKANKVAEKKMTNEPDFELLRSQLEESEREVMSIIDSVGTRKKDLVDSYAKAKSIEDLIELVAEPLCLATATMFFTLVSPGPINIVAFAQKKVAPKRYYKKIARSNAIFSECLLWLLDNFNVVCKDSGTFISEKDLDLIAVKSTIYWYRTNRLPKVESDMLKDELIHAIKSREENPPKDDKDQLVRVIDAYGRKPDYRTLGKFTRAAVGENPIQYLEPLAFSKKYEILISIDS